MMSARISAVASLTALVLFGLFLHDGGFDTVETARCATGLTALWAPYALAVFVLTRSAIDATIDRIAFSCCASFVLTTTVYFILAAAGVTPLFYVSQVAAASWAIIRLLRDRKTAHAASGLRRFDGVLAMLVVASLLTTMQYSKAFRVDASGEREFMLFSDHLYFAGISHELARSVPPRQMSIRAGTPERAYHMFPHLTVTLAAKYTGQHDMIRVLLSYLFPAVTAVLSLAVFSIASTVSGSAWAGYASVALLFPMAVNWPAINTGSIRPMQFYFTLFPNASSGLEPVMRTSPQMYAGLVGVFGFMLGMLWLAGRVRDARLALPLLTGLMAASLMRLRIHGFIAALPTFLAVTGWRFVRSRRLCWAAAAVIPAALALFLYLEMRSPTYLPASSGLKIGIANYSKVALLGAWPYAEVVFGAICKLFTNDAASLIWHFIALPAFVMFNIIGLPLLAASIMCVMARGINRDYVVQLWILVLLAVLGGMFLSSGYDGWSLGVQQLFMTRWFLLPLQGVSLIIIARWVTRRRRMSGDVIKIASAAIFLSFLVIRLCVPGIFPEGAADRFASGLRFSPGEWSALTYLREEIPAGYPVISNKYTKGEAYVFSGIGGHAAWIENSQSPVHAYAVSLSIEPEEYRDRIKVVDRLWEMEDPDAFCSLLRGTRSAILVEYSQEPLRVRNPQCLSLQFRSEQGDVTLWKVR